jgi:TRAP-type mannitol/chloroaromatic compound transport system permease small subunit
VSVWNPTEHIPGLVFDVAGIVGLAALGTVAVVLVVASVVARRHLSAPGDTSAGGGRPQARWAVKALVVLGLILLAIWSLPGYVYGPVPISGGAAWWT